MTEELINFAINIVLFIGLCFIIYLFVQRLVAEGELDDYRSSRLSSKAKKEILQAKRSGNERQIAEVLYREGAFDSAADLFSKLNIMVRAAESYEKAEKVSMAIQAYKRVGRHVDSARLAREHRMFSIAGQEYLALDRPDEAAACFKEGGELSQAADIYRQMGEFLSAGQLYENAGDFDAAIEQYLVALETLGGEPEEEDSERSSDGLVKRIAGLLLRKGDHDSAAKLLVKWGYFSEAAQLYLQREELEAAAEIYQFGQNFVEAAKIFERLGMVPKAATCRANIRMIEGDYQGAAEQFALAGEFQLAADAYHQGKDLKQAALFYEKAEDFLSAGKLWAEQGDIPRAIKVYVEGGEYAGAAQLLEYSEETEAAASMWLKGGNAVKAATVYFKSGQESKALEILREIEKGGESYQRARAVEGQILFKMGDKEKAWKHFKQAVRGFQVEESTIELFYRVARCAESMEKMVEARKIYREILRVDAGFADVNTRIEQLKGEGKQSPVLSTKDVMMAGFTTSPNDLFTSGVRSNQLQHARYEMLDEIARGGMGIVYRARDKVLNRLVAFKILTDKLKTNKTASEYFLREARAAAAMSHSNIVTVYDAGVQDGHYYMAMEYIDGETLKKMVKKTGAFPESLVRFIALNSSRGLAYAHEKGLVHRDVKSGNIMVTKERVLKIMDFGLAKFVKETQQDHTRAIGTPYYMSPEQIRGKDLDGRSDIYSLGATLFECASGEVPFSKGDLSYHHLHTSPPSPRSINPEISEQMEMFILRCMEKTPDKRFQTADDCIKYLKKMAKKKDAEKQEA